MIVFQKDGNEIKTGNVRTKKIAKNYDKAMEMGKKTRWCKW